MAALRILADENIPGDTVHALRNDGHKVDWIVEETPGIPDTEVWEIARARAAILLTRDKGYLPQLTKDQILHGPQVMVYEADGFSRDELRSTELFSHLIVWCLRYCDLDNLHFVTLALNGSHKSRAHCWGHELRRRKES